MSLSDVKPGWLRASDGEPAFTWVGRPHLAIPLLLALVALMLHARFGLVWSIGESMQPTYEDGELVVIDRAAYRNTAPQRDDVVVAQHLGGLIIKRVVALPGETVEVRNGRLLVNGRRLPEPHPVRSGGLTIRPGTLHAGRYALLGDNRSLAAGQAVHAIIAADGIEGRVLFSLPVGQWGRGDPAD